MSANIDPNMSALEMLGIALTSGNGAGYVDVERLLREAESEDTRLRLLNAELLAALKECVALLRLQKGNNLHDDDMLHVSELAIAKAEGRP